MDTIEDLFIREIIRKFEEKYHLLGYGSYRSFHITMYNYLKMGSFKLVENSMKKIGTDIYKHMDINFGLNKIETTEIIIKLLMIKL